MASTINAKNTSTGVVITPDASGQLELQTADTTRLTIDANGNVGIGTSSPEQLLHAYSTSSISTIFSEGVGIGATVQAISSGAAANVLSGRYDNSANGPTLALRKGRGTRASQTAIQTGDNLGGINYQGFCGTTTRTLSQITSWVENYTSDDNVSSDLRFITRPTGAGAALTERMRITSNGGIAFGGASNFGTSGQVLQSNGDAAPTWVSPSSGGMTLLGTVSATSGNSISLSGLNLSSYKSLYIVVNNVSSSVNNGNVYVSNNNTQSGNYALISLVSASVASSGVWQGYITVDLTTGFFAALHSTTSTATNTSPQGTWTNMGYSGITTSATIVYFRLSSTLSFDAGSFDVYGVK